MTLSPRGFFTQLALLCGFAALSPPEPYHLQYTTQTRRSSPIRLAMEASQSCP
jgi:hypothetical protein